MKASVAAKGSLLNFLVQIIETEAPELLKMSDKWIAVWAATEISLKQLASDVALLDQQVERVSQELAKLTVGTLFEGLDGLHETVEAPFTACLTRRLNSFLEEAVPKMESLRNAFNQAQTAIRCTMALFGEKLSSVGGNPSRDQGAHQLEDPCKQFFITIVDFIKAFYTVVDQNNRKRAEDVRTARIAAQMNALIEAKRNAKKLSAANLLNTDNPPVVCVPSPVNVDGPLALEVEGGSSGNQIEESPLKMELIEQGDYLDPDQVDSSGSPAAWRTSSRDDSMNYIRHTILGSPPLLRVLEGEATTGLRLSMTPKGQLSTADNIFERFHSAQEAPSVLVVDEYSMKLKKIGSNYCVAPEYENLYPYPDV